MIRAQKWIRYLLSADCLAALALLLISRYMENMKAVLPLGDPERTAAVYRMVKNGQSLKFLALALLRAQGVLGLGYLAVWGYGRAGRKRRIPRG